MKRCERCQTEYVGRCPVCEGYSEEFAQYIERYYGVDPNSEVTCLGLDIAARDAAMQKRGRLKGLEEAAEMVGDLDVPREKACWNYTDGFKDGRHMAEQAIRAAAETAKEGGDVG